VRDPASFGRIATTIDPWRWIVAKLNAFLVGLGVLLIMLAGGLGVQLLMSGSGDDEVTTTPTHTPRPSGVPSGRPTAVAPGPSVSTSLVPVSVSAPKPKVSSSAPKPSASPSPAPPSWSMVWSDGFTSGSLSQEWTATTSEATGQDASCHIAANVGVNTGDGALALSADRPATPYTCGGTTTTYTGAHVLVGIPQSAWAGGAVQVRARTLGALSAGLSPGIWLTDANIAILGTGGVDSTQWHTFRIEWDATGVRWSVSDPNETTWTALAPSSQTICASGCQLNIDYNVGGSATPGDPPYPQFEIDYVQVFKKG
jgi:hypothetical protein